mgnify:CR=1 FL=1
MSAFEPGAGGTAAEIDSLNGWTIEAADIYLKAMSALVKLTVTAGRYRHYRFADTSEVVIRPNGEVIRLPQRQYDEDGNRIRGLRIDSKTGAILRSDEWHNLPEESQEWVVM